MINPQTGLAIDWPETGHMAVFGKTGCGKTALAALPLTMRSLRAGHAVLFIDLSGAPEVVHQVRLIAEAMGRRFRFVSTVDGLDTEYVNVFQDRPYRVSDIQLAGTLLEGSGIHRGSGYGKAHFADACAAPACQVIAMLRQQRIPLTVPTVSEHLRRLNVSTRGMEHITNSVQILTHIRFLAEEGPEHRRLLWHDVVERGDFVFCHAPTRNSPQSAKAAAMLQKSLVTYLDVRKLAGSKARPIDIYEDEAAWLANQQSATDMSMDRVLGVTYYLFAQSIEQMDAESKMVGQIILDNCATTLWFTPFSKREVEFIQSHSADAKYWLESHTEGPNGPSVTRREDRDYRVSRDDILKCARSDQTAVLVRRTGDGDAEPIPVVLDYLLPKCLFERLENTPLPLARLMRLSPRRKLTAP